MRLLYESWWEWHVRIWQRLDRWVANENKSNCIADTKFKVHLHVCLSWVQIYFYISHHSRRAQSTCPVRLMQHLPVKTSNLLDKCLITGAGLCTGLAECLHDTKYKQNPNQTVLNKVLRLKGTPCDILWCLFKAASISAARDINIMRFLMYHVYITKCLWHFKFPFCHLPCCLFSASNNEQLFMIKKLTFAYLVNHTVCLIIISYFLLTLVTRMIVFFIPLVTFFYHTLWKTMLT